MMHKDCGACGGSKAFGDDDTVETEALVKKLNEGKEFLKNNLPKDILIETFIVCFDCIQQLE